MIFVIIIFNFLRYKLAIVHLFNMYGIPLNKVNGAHGKKVMDRHRHAAVAVANAPSLLRS